MNVGNGMALSEAAVREAKKASRAYKKHDREGLFLHVLPTGTRVFRIKYTIDGRERVLTLGRYPALSLGEARRRRNEIRDAIAEGRDPAGERQAARAARREAAQPEARKPAERFGALAEDWYNRAGEEWSSSYRRTVWARLEHYLLPRLGQRPIDEITPNEVFETLDAIEAREVAMRVRQYAQQVFRHAVSRGLIAADPSRDVSRSLKRRPPPRHRPAIIDEAAFGRMMADIRRSNADPVRKIALQLLSHCVPRPGELRKARWEDIDLTGDRSDAPGITGPVWRLDGSVTKMRRVFDIPLSRQAVTLFRKLHALTGDGALCFPLHNGADRPIHMNALGDLLKSIGYGGDVHVPHGARSSFSSICHGRNAGHTLTVERCLQHLDPNEIRRIYDRRERWDERRALMQWWSDFVISAEKSSVSG